jgi:hypothetical protein
MKTVDKITVAFDVDDTLWTDYDDEKENHVIEKNLDLYKLFERLGCQMFIWSRAGEEHAQEIADKLNLKGKVIKKQSFIPDIAVDDAEYNLGRHNINV